MWFKTIVELVTGVAWPLVVLGIAWIFRSELRSVLTSRNARFKAGPIELAIEQARVGVEGAASFTTNDDVPSAAAAPPVINSLPPIADPTGTVIRAYAQLEDALRKKFSEHGESAMGDWGRSGVQMASRAAQQGLITDAAAEAVRGVAVLRNLAAHGQRQVTAVEARDYVALVEATIYSLRPTPRDGQHSTS